jgi:hypothetical protein
LYHQFIRRGSSILGTVDNAQTLLIDQTIIELKLIDNCRAGGSDLCPFGLGIAIISRYNLCV